VAATPFGEEVAHDPPQEHGYGRVPPPASFGVVHGPPQRLSWQASHPHRLSQPMRMGVTRKPPHLSGSHPQAFFFFYPNKVTMEKNLAQVVTCGRLNLLTECLHYIKLAV
jgi:hypothetical protein